MSEKLGVITHEGQMYDLDTLSEEDLKNLLFKVEEHAKRLEAEAEIISDN